MKVFIEAIEITEFEQGEVIRESVKITAGAAIAAVAEKMASGKTYALRKHICRHDEHPIKPCIAENIGEKEIADAVLEYSALKEVV